MNQNPYRAPIQSAVHDTKEVSPRVEVDFRSLLVKWEKYRLVYNSALIVTTVFTGLAFGVSPWMLDFWLVAIFGALFANLMFMLGPSLDGYLQVAGFRHRLIGLFIFGCGTVIAVLLAALTVASL